MRHTGLALLLLVGCAADPIAQNVLRRSTDRPTLRPGTVAIRWLGTAGFEVRTRSHVILIDPYLTRAPLSAIALGRLAPDRPVLERAVPAADFITVSHSHFDHLLDAPAISARTGAVILASGDACRVATGLEPSATCRAARLYREIDLQGVRFTALPAHHGETLIGVPISGTNDRPPRSRAPHVTEMRVGPTLIWVVRAEGVTIVHAGTAGLPVEPLVLSHLLPDGADVLLVALALRENAPGYPRHLIDVLGPRVIIPHHPALPTFELTDPLPEDIRDTFDEFAREEGDSVHVPEPFVPIVIRARPRAP